MSTTNHEQDDARLDALLARLHSVEPDPGMEARVRAAVEAAAARQQSSFWRRWWPVAATAVAVPVLAMLVLTVGSRRFALHPQPVAALATPPAEGAPQRSLAPRSAAGEPAARSSRARLASLPAREPAAATAPHTPGGRDAAPLTAADLLALEETRAPSRPATELPLTPEERTLRHAARGRVPIEIAELLPEQRAAALRREATEFEEFFDVVPAAATQSPQGDPEGESHDENKSAP